MKSFGVYSFVVVIICICAVNSELNDKHRIVDTKNGQVRGVRKTTLFKKIDFYSFKGIPYAKSPTGELRFKPPVPIESWSPNVLDAFEHGPICIQPVLSGLAIEGQAHSEDCLFLNIYVPADIKPNEKLAVMVHIHGGGYGVGSGNDDIMLGPDFLIEQRVILATLNYRLGVFGFMSFGTPEYSGNMGLKDQQLAMKWIHSNIDHFSGDNKRITLFGTSAGGASTHLQSLSSESRKYFRNIIPMSGTAEVYWALSENSENHLKYAHKIAGDLGESSLSLQELIDFFKAVPAHKMGEYGNLIGFLMRTCSPIMKPVIESKDAIQPFIVEDPSKIYEQSDVDVDAIFSLAKYESITFLPAVAKDLHDLNGFDRNFSLVLPFRGAALDFSSQLYQRIAKEIREFYFKDAAIDDNTLKQYINLLSDVNFAYGIDKAARQHAAKTNSKSYYMRFSVDSKLSIGKNLLGPSLISGASHGDDICHIFRCEAAQGIYDDILQNQNDKESKIALKTIENMTKLLSNFAKYGEPVHNGDPISELLPVQNDQVNFIDVTKDGLKPGVNPNREANELWARIDQLSQIADNSAFQSREEL